MTALDDFLKRHPAASEPVHDFIGPSYLPATARGAFSKKTAQIYKEHLDKCRCVLAVAALSTTEGQHISKPVFYYPVGEGFYFDSFRRTDPIIRDDDSDHKYCPKICFTRDDLFLSTFVCLFQEAFRTLLTQEMQRIAFVQLALADGSIYVRGEKIKKRILLTTLNFSSWYFPSDLDSAKDVLQQAAAPPKQLLDDLKAPFRNVDVLDVMWSIFMEWKFNPSIHTEALSTFFPLAKAPLLEYRMPSRLRLFAVLKDRS